MRTTTALAAAQVGTLLALFSFSWAVPVFHPDAVSHLLPKPVDVRPLIDAAESLANRRNPPIRLDAGPLARPARGNPSILGPWHAVQTRSVALLSAVRDPTPAEIEEIRARIADRTTRLASPWDNPKDAWPLYYDSLSDVLVLSIWHRFTFKDNERFFQLFRTALKDYEGWLRLAVQAGLNVRGIPLRQLIPNFRDIRHDVKAGLERMPEHAQEGDQTTRAVRDNLDKLLEAISEGEKNVFWYLPEMLKRAKLPQDDAVNRVADTLEVSLRDAFRSAKQEYDGLFEMYRRKLGKEYDAPTSAEHDKWYDERWFLD